MTNRMRLRIPLGIIFVALILGGSLVALGACGGEPATPALTDATVTTQPGEGAGPAARPSPTTATQEPTVAPQPTAAGVQLASLSVFPETTQPLQVVASQPSDGAEGAAVDKDDARIVVQFNHPVVPLVSVEEQVDLASPLSIEPSIEGEGQWLNTSTFEFRPTEDLQPSTQYQVTVEPGLTDILGAALTGGYRFTFMTAFPAVVNTYPESNSIHVGVTQPMTITFNQPMDRASAQQAFRAAPAEGGPAVTGSFAWSGPNMVFTPDVPLAYDTTYVATVSAGAQAATGQATAQGDYTWRFKTVEPPAVASTAPEDGEESATSIREGFMITFSSPMDPEELQVTIQPTITNQSVWWSDSETVAHVTGGWLASETYTVTVEGESLSRYGDPLGEDTVVTFTAAPMEPRMFLNTPPGEFSLYSAYGTPRLYATFTNVDQIDFTLYAVDRSDLLRLMGENRWQVWDDYLPPADNVVRQWSVPTDAELNATSAISTSLATDAGGQLEPGVYLIRAQSEPATSSQNKTLLIVSQLNLALKRAPGEALVWATDLQSGQPVAGQPIAIYDHEGNRLIEGQTDSDGVFRGTLVRQTEPWRPTFALSEVDGNVVAAVGTDWQIGIGPWEFGIPYNPQPQQYYATIYTDRPLYRAGQTVYFRGVLRNDDDGDYSLPDLETVPITVRDSQGKELLQTDVGLSEFGTFNGEVQLSPAAPLGFYQIEMVLGPEGPGRQYFGQGFQVAAFRTPDFQIEVSTDQPEYVQGDTINVDVLSTYFFGGPVASGELRWRLLKDDFFFQPEGLEGFWDFVDTDVTRERFANPQGEVVSEGEGELDAEGRFNFEIPADVSEYPLSQVFTIDVEITDINNQAVSSRDSVVVHKGNLYIGLRPQEYVGTVGDELGVDVFTVDIDGEPVAEQMVDMEFYQRTWYSVREKREDGSFYWTSAYTDTLVSETQVTTDADGRAVAQFTPREGGVHRAVGTTTDAAGNEIRSATYVWVASGDFVNWRQENNDRIELVADKKRYQPGDIAEILVPAPFEDSEALLTIERGTIREVRRMHLGGNSETVQVPIQSDYVPNIYVSIMLVKGTDEDNPVPQFKVGYINLEVSKVEKILAVTVRPDQLDAYGPGDTVNFNVDVVNHEGQPVQAELSLALVDKALLSLTGDTAQSLEQAFYGQRMLAVNTAASLTRSADRLNQQLDSEKKGGGGSDMETGTIRRTFRDTAYWNAAVVTDENGQAEVSVTLPDNLTTWNMKAKAVTGPETLVGRGEADIVSTKDVLVRPVTPRFVVVGDTVQLEAVVNNNTSEAVDLEVVLESPHVDITSEATQALSVPARGRAEVVWQTAVPASGFFRATAPEAYGEVLLRMLAEGSGYSDAVELTLPVYQFSSPEVVATAGQVGAEETSAVEQIDLPDDIDTSRGELTLELAPSLAAASVDSLRWLESFPYECSEQVVSKFLPNIATYQALQDLGLDRPELRSNLEVQVTREIQQLYALQHPDGGWGWWLADESRPWLTAYALFGMDRANNAGFAVNPDVMNRAAEYLTNSLDQPVDVELGYDLNQRAFIVYVLSERGGLPASRVVTLYDRREPMAHYAQAFLALALANVEGDQSSRIDGIIADLTGAAQLSATGTHWEEAEVDFWTMNTDTRTTAIALLTLARLAPDHPSLANAVRWLMTMREEGHWETTQETAWSVLGLTAFMRSTGELDASYTYRVELNDEGLDSGDVDATNVDQPIDLVVPISDLLLTVANELVIARDGTGRLYYTAHLRYFPPAAGLEPLDRGIVVGRQYFQVDPATLQPTGERAESAEIGDVVQVKLTIIAPNDLHYLVVEDPLPAGFEAIDTSLKTASAAAQGPQLEEVVPEDEELPWWERRWWSHWTESQLRDEKVALFATFLGRGTYEYTYLMRASVAGNFNVPPAVASEMYFPEVFGRSAGGVFSVALAE